MCNLVASDFMMNQISWHRKYRDIILIHRIQRFVSSQFNRNRLSHLNFGAATFAGPLLIVQCCVDGVTFNRNGQKPSWPPPCPLCPVCHNHTHTQVRMQLTQFAPVTTPSPSRSNWISLCWVLFLFNLRPAPNRTIEGNEIENKINAKNTCVKEQQKQQKKKNTRKKTPLLCVCMRRLAIYLLYAFEGAEQQQQQQKNNFYTYKNSNSHS